jgi:DNA-binding transcriptional ArsR family regulator
MAKNGKKKTDIDVSRTSKMLKAIADTDRLRLVLQLKTGEKSVGTLADAIGADIVNVSHHLGVLRGGGLVRDKKIGRFVFYALNPDVIIENDGHLHFRLAGCTLVIK